MNIHNGLAYDGISPSRLWLRLRAWLLVKLANGDPVMINVSLKISEPILIRPRFVVTDCEVNLSRSDGPVFIMDERSADEYRGGGL